jgi:hypothetical protein
MSLQIYAPTEWRLSIYYLFDESSTVLSMLSPSVSRTRTLPTEPVPTAWHEQYRGFPADTQSSSPLYGIGNGCATCGWNVVATTPLPLIPILRTSGASPPFQTGRHHVRTSDKVRFNGEWPWRSFRRPPQNLLRHPQFWNEKFVCNSSSPMKQEELT